MAAFSLEGEVTIDTLGENYPMLTGNLVAICLSGIVCVAVSLVNPDNYDWESTRQIKMVEADDNAWHNKVDYDEEALTKAKAWIMKIGLAFTVVIVIIWPVLSLPAGVFSKGYFDFWVCFFVFFFPEVVVVVWLFCFVCWSSWVCRWGWGVFFFSRIFFFVCVVFVFGFSMLAARTCFCTHVHVPHDIILHKAKTPQQQATGKEKRKNNTHVNDPLSSHARS